MRPITLSLALALILLIGTNASAQPADPDNSQKVYDVEHNLLGVNRSDGEGSWSITERMAHYKVKGVSIAVIKNYKLDWAKGYGWADEDMKISVTPETVFQAASISKSLNAVGVLKLVQDRKLNLNADINSYLHDIKGQENMLYWKFPYDSLSKNKKITTANLLSHTAGLSIHGFAGYERGTDIPNLVQVLNGQLPANSKPVLSMYEPGIKYEYSGGGITISQLIVMNVSHQSYEKYMDENILKPLDMTSSTYSQFPQRDKQKFYSAAYYANGKEVPGKYHVYPEEAAAGLWTNPTDLAKYIIETQLAYEGKSTKVLNQQMTRLRLTPYVDKSAALGVFIEDYNGVKYFTHSGANEGFRSQYYGSLENGNGLVIMVNSDNGNIIPEIVNSIAKVYGFKGLYRSNEIKIKELNVANNILQNYIGKYEIDPDNILTVTLDGAQLYGEVKGRGKFGLFPESENKFIAKAIDVEFEFVRDSKGSIIKAIIYQDGAHDARKLK